MLRTIILFCLRFRLVVLLLAAAFLAWGAEAARRAPWDVFPEFAPPQVVVQTEAPGLTSEEVERLITVPLESALNGVTGIEALRSTSIQGLSVITAIFAPGADVLAARQLVNERLVQAERRLPAAAEPPRMAPVKASTSRLLMLGLTSERVSPLELRALADWVFQRRLLAVPGVAQVEVFGGQEKQLQVLVSPQRLAQYDVTLDDVAAAARAATGFGGAGFLETANQRLPIRQRTRLQSPEDLAAAPVARRDGVVLTLGRLADVGEGPAPKAGDAQINGRPGVLLIVHKEPGANTLETTERVERVVKQLRSALPPGVTLHPTLFRQAAFVERALANLNVSIAIGCVLVAGVLVAFLFQWRTVLISLTAIPLSLLGAIAVLRLLGASLNTMTLGGLAVALGAVVDDAIVDVENVHRRLRDNLARPTPQSAVHVVLDASLEVRSAIVYASFIVIMVFAPVMCLEGLAGTFFRAMGAAYMAAIAVSLVVSLTVTPAMCLWLLGRDLTAAGAPPRPSPIVGWLQAAYRRTLRPALRRPRWVIAGAALAVAGALAAAPFLGGEFLPEFREANFVLFMSGKPDASLGESRRVGRLVAQRLLKIPGVLSAAQQLGRAELSEDTWGPNISEIWVRLDPRADYAQLVRRVREAMADLPGWEFQVKPFLRERVDEVLTGATADIVIRVAGTQLPQLRSVAERVAAAVGDVPGIEDLRVEQVVDTPQIDVELQPNRLAKWGLAVGQANQAIQTLLRGRTVGQVYQGDRVFDVVVRADPRTLSRPDALGRLLIDLPPQQPVEEGETSLATWRPGGQRTEKIPLRAVAHIAVRPGPYIVSREAGSRRVLVTCNAEGRDVAGVVRDMQARIAQALPQLPPGCRLEFGGEYEARQAAQRRLALLSVAALLAIFLLLDLDFRSARLAALVMASVPLACVGGLAAAALAGGDLSLGSLVGFVTVFGIAVRNGILLISHYQRLERETPAAARTALLLQGSAERLAPILMTALTTALALLPVIILGDRPGHEIERPMAIVVVGGLASSTLLSLVVLPALYRLFGRPQPHEL